LAFLKVIDPDDRGLEAFARFKLEPVAHELRITGDELHALHEPSARLERVVRSVGPDLSPESKCVEPIVHGNCLSSDLTASRCEWRWKGQLATNVARLYDAEFVDLIW
jgi:hypothetical protein